MSYPWIVTGLARRTLPPWQPARKAMAACGRCGWEWRGRRKTCPACLGRTDVT